MELVEYRASDNTLGLSIKYPTDIPRKWSEADDTIQCETCSSTDISSDISGDMLVIACHDCANYWTGTKSNVLTWHDTEEALISLWRIPFESAE